MKSAKFHMSSPITYSFLFLSKTEWYSLSRAFWYSSLNIRGGSYSQENKCSLEQRGHLNSAKLRMLTSYLPGTCFLKTSFTIARSFHCCCINNGSLVTISNYWNCGGNARKIQMQCQIYSTLEECVGLLAHGALRYRTVPPLWSRTASWNERPLPSVVSSN